mmetsp:Transcript_9330/g.31812  ORF Transcript_9330/g.31812 Transcript_9330/m.31812 type:complete len:89 (-) Transcript_9330:235-501(-)
MDTARLRLARGLVPRLRVLAACAECAVRQHLRRSPAALRAHGRAREAAGSRGVCLAGLEGARRRWLGRGGTKSRRGAATSGAEVGPVD